MKSESEVAQSCLTLRDPMVCSLPGSSVHGIFQARVLEWGAIAFSTHAISNNICVCVHTCACALKPERDGENVWVFGSPHLSEPCKTDRQVFEGGEKEAR